MRRRAFLGKVGVGGTAAILGGGSVAVAEHLRGARATPETFASTVAQAAVRGSSAVWWSAPRTDRVLALTFDDGPTEQFTAEVLDLLDRLDLRATFFLIGELALRFPDLVRRARDAGHEIANHSQDHYSAAVLGRDDVRTAMARGADTVEAVTGTRPRWYRPPRGEITSATLLAALATQQEVALWSVARDAGGETRDGDVEGVRRFLTGAAHPGAVVDLHDGIGRSSFSGLVDRSLLTRRRAELDALPAVLQAWIDQGYRLVTMSELIPRQRG